MKSILDETKIFIHTAKFSKVDSRWSRKVFPYPHHRIYYVTGGEARLVLNDRKLKLKKGHVYLLPAFSLVKAVCKNFMSYYYIHFQSVLGFEYNIFEIYKLNLAVKAKKNTRKLFKNIIENYENSSLSSGLLTTGSFKLILAPFFSGVSLPESNTKRFYEILSYIENNLTKKIEISILAEIMELNTVYFSNLFSKTFGLAPKQYIIKKRLEKAQLLLANTDKKVKEIAFESGFDSEMYFSRLFRKKTDITPGEYRKLFIS